MYDYFSDNVYLNYEQNKITPFSYHKKEPLVFLDNNIISKSIHIYWTNGHETDIVKELRNSVEKILKELKTI